MNPEVDLYLKDGCGRCSMYQTPDCKVHAWQKELVALRNIALASPLTEELKWKQPCYVYMGKNVIIVSAFKDYAFISFLKGAMLKDEKSLLTSPGKNSQSAKQLRFTDTETITELEPLIKSYIEEAIELEKSGAKIESKKVDAYPIPVELQQKLKSNPTFKTAFEGLTPGRQKGYLLYFNGAKQSKTREARIEKYLPKILKGLGFHDR